MWADTRMLLPRSFYAYAGLDFSCIGGTSRIETGHLAEQEDPTIILVLVMKLPVFSERDPPKRSVFLASRSFDCHS